MKIKIILTSLLIAILVFGFWIYKSSKTAKPGEEVGEMGREHVTDIYGVQYNSRPPTSGPHFPIWAKRGLYDRFISDGYLIHSLEHGYIVISYKCDDEKSLTLVRSVYAHEEPTKESTDSGEVLMHMKVKQEEGMSFFTPGNPPDVELELPESFQSEGCKALVEGLKAYLGIAERVIIVPRGDMDSRIALTAWGRMLKLESIEKEQMEQFIKTYHNRGPEATQE